jgi:hypothetical protein
MGNTVANTPEPEYRWNKARGCWEVKMGKEDWRRYQRPPKHQALKPGQVLHVALEENETPR